MEDIIRYFELYLFDKNIKIKDVDENVINEYCSELFYDLEDEEDLDRLNQIEEVIRKYYLKESE